MAVRGIIRLQLNNMGSRFTQSWVLLQVAIISHDSLGKLPNFSKLFYICKEGLRIVITS